MENSVDHTGIPFDGETFYNGRWFPEFLATREAGETRA